ncbi:hypothetical protein Airi02_034730 [Actinoallomurus iriomotensis]|uniref:Uncharacterized protein n=1 Tax=Actinoallomurus iriomotensis TaxID=478107 RepID=A0A9W6S1T9_9ACTN|nr:hypothetical protein Airi02_034730 [Actinoallomurus iriomotensis]
MKAVRIHQHGGSSVLQVESAPLPVLGANDVLVRVHTTAVNPVNSLVRDRFSSSPTARSRGPWAGDFAGMVIDLEPSSHESLRIAANCSTLWSPRHVNPQVLPGTPRLSPQHHGRGQNSLNRNQPATQWGRS